MIARLDHLPMVDDDNLVGIPDSAQTVGYDDNGFSLIKRVEVFHDGPLVVGIERVGSLVEEDTVGLVCLLFFEVELQL